MGVKKVAKNQDESKEEKCQGRKQVCMQISIKVLRMEVFHKCSKELGKCVWKLGSKELGKKVSK